MRILNILWLKLKLLQPLRLWILLSYRVYEHSFSVMHEPRTYQKLLSAKDCPKSKILYIDTKLGCRLGSLKHLKNVVNRSYIGTRQTITNNSDQFQIFRMKCKDDFSSQPNNFLTDNCRYVVLERSVLKVSQWSRPFHYLSTQFGYYFASCNNV